MGDRIEPARPRLPDLHARVTCGDSSALGQLASEVSPLLRRRLRRSFQRASTDLIIDAANDAILAYATRPQVFDASRNVPLDGFLYGIAARILRDRLRGEQRRHVRERAYAEHVERAFGDRTDNRATSSAVIQAVRRALPLVCDPTELAAVVVWLHEDDSGAVAVRLGLSHLERTEQRREVKRFISRVAKRLRRRFGRGQRHEKK